MGTTKFYDPDLVTFTFAGVTVDGYATDGMLSVEFSDEAFKVVRGLDGVLSRSKVLGRYATITCKLMQTSRSNAVFTGIHTQDLLSSGGAGVSPVMLKDGNGASIVVSDEAWINGFPNIDYGGEAGPREWKITVALPKVIEGGT